MSASGRATGVPRTQCGAVSGITRVFDTLWCCTAEPGPSSLAEAFGEALGPGSVEQRYALHRVRDTNNSYFLKK